MKKMTNNETIIGRVYKHDLKVKTVKNPQSENYGKEFIGGKLEIAVDEDGLNVIKIDYSYVTPITKNGKPNSTYNALKKIIDAGNVWEVVGKDKAAKVKATPSLDLNDFYDINNDQMISARINSGGFIEFVNELPEDESTRHRFEVDMLINNITPIEANEERETPAKVAVRGYVFDFKGMIKPVEFSVFSEAGMAYFESLEVSPAEPLLTKVWGLIESKSIDKEITEESAFGGAVKKVVKRSFKDWVLTGAAPMAYDFGADNVMTEDELKKAIQDREVYLAGVKNDRIKYEQEKGQSANAFNTAPTTGAAPSATAAPGGYTF